MKKTIIIGLCLTLALALIGTVALARGPGFGRGFGPGFGAGPGSDYPAIPNLTAEQSAQIKALQEAFLKEKNPFRRKWRQRVRSFAVYASLRMRMPQHSRQSRRSSSLCGPSSRKS